MDIDAQGLHTIAPDGHNNFVQSRSAGNEAAAKGGSMSEKSEVAVLRQRVIELLAIADNPKANIFDGATTRTVARQTLTYTSEAAEKWERAIRNRALEDAANACDDIENRMSAAFVKANEYGEGKEKIDYIEGIERGASKCADAIRAKKEKV